MCQINFVNLFAVLATVSLINDRALSSTNNANISWYEAGDPEPKHFVAGDSFPKGLINAYKIVVNQQFPVLWEVKFSYFDKLEYLILDSIGVEEIKPGTFKELKPLTNLSISNNRVTEVRNGVFSSIRVINLDLSHNQIDTIADGAFKDMPSLRVLLLDFNKLKAWQGSWFENSPNIALLSFSHNQIEQLPETFLRNSSEALNVRLNNNQIKKIHPRAFEGLKRIGDVILSHNQLIDIDEKLFDDLEKMAVVDFTQNPLICPSESFSNRLIKEKSAKLFYDCVRTVENERHAVP